MLTGQALLIAVYAALAIFLGEEAIKGAKWLGHEAKKGGAAVVHVLKKIPHPHHREDPHA